MRMGVGGWGGEGGGACYATSDVYSWSGSRHVRTTWQILWLCLFLLAATQQCVPLFLSAADPDCTSCENTHKAAVYHPRFMKNHQSAVCLQSPAHCAIMLAGLCLFSSVEGGFIATLSYTWYLDVNLLCRQLWLLTLSQRGYSIFIF